MDLAFCHYMPLKPRNIQPGNEMHTVFRIRNREFLFVDPFDHRLFIETLRRQKKRYEAAIYAWVGMSNHHHVFNEAPRKWHHDTEFARLQDRLQKPVPVGYMIKDSFSFFANRFNRVKGRDGGIIKDRTRTVKVYDHPQALILLLYIFLNPVRAGLTRDPKDYPYSNYRQYAFGEITEFDIPFNLHPAYLNLANSPLERQERFRRLVHSAQKDWAKMKWIGASASHGCGRGKFEKAREEFDRYTSDWLRCEV